MKCKKLSGAALDWAVAKAEGLNPNTDPEMRRQYVGYSGFAEGNGFGYPIKNYSTDWAQGGPIIERERIDVFSTANGTGWCAQSDVRVYSGYGPTPLVAAMRCYVASKLGDEIEIPEELK